MTAAEEYLEERAAIREYCGDQTREAAERGAAADLEAAPGIDGTQKHLFLLRRMAVVVGERCG